MKVLAVTHSSREFLDERARLNALENRFLNRDWTDLPPIESFSSVTKALPHPARISFWRIESSASPKLAYHSMYTPDYPVQFIDRTGTGFVVTGADRLVQLDENLTETSRVQDPWISGTHTVHVDKEGSFWVTCAPANAILRVNAETNEVVERIKMPGMYGAGYEITEATDLRKHLIPTDFQPTHVNCAVPTDMGVLVTSWIPGAIGLFDRNRNYREIVRGFRGIHGARLEKASGHILVADSPAGCVLTLDVDSGALVRRTRFSSDWIHDAIRLDDRFMVVSLTDRNEVQIVDRQTGHAVFRQPCHAQGETTRFLNIFEVGEDWLGATATPPTTDLPPLIEDLWARTNLLSDATIAPFWSWQGTPGSPGLHFTSDAPCKFEYLLMSEPLRMSAGLFGLGAEIKTHRGSVDLMLIDERSLERIDAVSFGPLRAREGLRFELSKQRKVRLVLAAANVGGSMPVDFDLLDIRIVGLDDRASLRIPISLRLINLMRSLFRRPMRGLIKLMSALAR